MSAAASAQPNPFLSRPKTERYENEEVIKWLLEPERVRAMLGQFPSGRWKWDTFLKEQEDLRQKYRERDQVAPFSRALSFTKEKMFLHSHRIPVKIDEILLKMDPELDGSNPRKLERFLHDFPVFDLRQRKSR